MIRLRRYVISVVVVVALAGTSLAGLLYFGTTPRLGLDLQGGLSVVLTATEDDVDTEVLDRTVEIIRSRVDALGAQEPDISRAGANNIMVQLPGIDDPDRALEIIGQTAQLRFREVLDTVDVGVADPEELEAAGWVVTENDPLGQEVVFPHAEDPVWYRLGPAEVVGDHVGNAFHSFEPGTGWHVTLDLRGEGVQAWAEVTTRLAPTNQPLAIVLDRQVESAPQVVSPITDGRAQITGQFSEGDARDLALVLRTGALPIELERSQVQRVSATLGTASLRAGLLAGAIGLGLVMIFILAFYRLLGIVVLLGLAVFGVMILGLIGAISTFAGFSLTLAGVAGLIVAIGIAADSYIIYFERVKDEVRDGRTFRSAVDHAFRSALRTNLAANTVVLFAAVILYMLAIGPVRGFALTIGMSVALDLGLMYFFAHPLIMIFSRRRKSAGMGIIGMPQPAKAAEEAPPEAVKA